MKITPQPTIGAFKAMTESLKQQPATLQNINLIAQYHADQQMIIDQIFKKTFTKLSKNYGWVRPQNIGIRRLTSTAN